MGGRVHFVEHVEVRGSPLCSLFKTDEGDCWMCSGTGTDNNRSDCGCDCDSNDPKARCPECICKACDGHGNCTSKTCKSDTCRDERKATLDKFLGLTSPPAAAARTSTSESR